MREASVFTIIPNWNLKNDLCECLDSLSRATYKNHKVIVVDNASSDGSQEAVRSNFPWVYLIELNQNLGYAAALNHGITYALDQGADYIFILNNDTVIPPTTIEQLIETAEIHPEAGIIAPKIMYFENQRIIYSLGDRRYKWLPLPWGFGYRKFDSGKFTRLEYFDYVSGCAFLIRSEIIQIVGLFNCNYFMYYEDADFCRRVRDKGFHIISNGRIFLYHKASLSAKQQPEKITYIRARNRGWFYRRYHHGPHPLLTLSAILLVAVWKITLNIFNKQNRIIKPYISGLWDGLTRPIPE